MSVLMYGQKLQPPIISLSPGFTVTVVVLAGVDVLRVLDLLQHSLHDGQHHGGGGRVGHPHGQEPRDQHHPQHQPTPKALEDQSYSGFLAFKNIVILLPFSLF